MVRACVWLFIVYACYISVIVHVSKSFTASISIIRLYRIVIAL